MARVPSDERPRTQTYTKIPYCTRASTSFGRLSSGGSPAEGARGRGRFQPAAHPSPRRRAGAGKTNAPRDAPSVTAWKPPCMRARGPVQSVHYGPVKISARGNRPRGLRLAPIRASSSSSRRRRGPAVSRYACRTPGGGPLTADASLAPRAVHLPVPTPGERTSAAAAAPHRTRSESNCPVHSLEYHVHARTRSALVPRTDRPSSDNRRYYQPQDP